MSEAKSRLQVNFMRYSARLFCLLLLALFLNACNNQNFQNPPEDSKQFVKTAVIYALETRDPNMDYSKYVSKNFINHVDSNTFDFKQWVTHQKNIKSLIKSIKPDFKYMVSDGTNVAAVYFIHLIKNDGSELDVKDIAYFRIKDHKIIYVDELTHLITGNQADKNIGSLK
jgi:hypothetical protein